MTDQIRFTPLNLESSTIRFTPIETPQPQFRQAKGIATRQFPEEAARSQDALKFLAKSIGLGGLKTLLSTTGGAKYISPSQLQQYLSTGEIGPSGEESLQQLIGRGEAETPEQVILGRIGETAGSLPFLPGGAPARAAVPLLAGAAGGGAVEAATGSRTAGDVAELAGTAGLSLLKPAQALSKSFISKSGNSLKRLGFSPSSLVLIANEEQGKVAKIGEKASKTKGLTKALGSLEDEIGTAFDNLEKRALKGPPAPKKANQALISHIDELIKDLERTVKPSSRKEKALKYLLGSRDNLQKGLISKSRAIEWYRDIGEEINWNKLGRKHLAPAQEAIKEYLQTADPKLAKEFNLLNEAYVSKLNIFKELQSKDLAPLLSKSDFTSLQKALFKGPVPFGRSLVNKLGLGRLRAARLHNPKFQHLTTRLKNAVESGNYTLAKNISRQIKYDTPEDLPDEEESET